MWAVICKREVGALIHRELRDPRIGSVSVVGVDVSRDLSHANIYVTVLGCEDAEAAAPSLVALNGASGHLRSRMAATAELRAMPRLRFFYDRGVSNGRRVEALMRPDMPPDVSEPGYAVDSRVSS